MAIKKGVKRYKHGEQPRFRAKTPEEGLRELERLRRLLPELTGDPDKPMVKVVTFRKPPLPKDSD